MRSAVTLCFIGCLLLVTSALLRGSPQSATALSGQWSLNRSASEFPKEIGFTADWVRTAVEHGTEQGGGGGGRGGGRGGRRGGSGGGGSTSRPAAPFTARESADDAKRVQVLTDEVRNPPAQITITDIDGVVTITNDQSQARSFHPGGGEEVLHFGDLPVRAVARWESDRLVVVYNAEEGHQLRYTYSASSDPRRLRVDVQFVERGGGDSVIRYYDPSSATDAHRATAPPGAPDSVPASSQPAAMAPPGSELHGLRTVGIVVEDLDVKASECGLSRSALEAAASKALSNAGLKVAINADEDTYLYINVMTSTMASGFCVSRYDVSLFTTTTATLSYQTKPSLVQVSLLHKGGFAGGAAAQHAAGVMQGITQYSEQFATQIRDANR